MNISRDHFVKYAKDWKKGLEGFVLIMNLSVFKLLTYCCLCRKTVHFPSALVIKFLVLSKKEMEILLATL